MWRLRHRAHLSEDDTVVLTDFVNMTGESIFDGALKPSIEHRIKTIAVSECSLGSEGCGDPEAYESADERAGDATGWPGDLPAHER
jgi:hypothetical protein